MRYREKSEEEDIFFTRQELEKILDKLFSFLNEAEILVQEKLGEIIDREMKEDADKLNISGWFPISLRDRQVIDLDKTVHNLSSRRGCFQTPKTCDILYWYYDKLVFIELKRFKFFKEKLKEAIIGGNFDEYEVVVIENFIKSFAPKFLDSLLLILFLFPLLNGVKLKFEERWKLFKYLKLEFIVLTTSYIETPFQIEDDEDYDVELHSLMELASSSRSNKVYRELMNESFKLIKDFLPSHLIENTKFYFFYSKEDYYFYLFSKIVLHFNLISELFGDVFLLYFGN